MVLVWYGVLVLGPAVGLGLMMSALDHWSRGVSWPRRPAPERPTGPSLERLVSDLRRLEEQFRRVEERDDPGRQSRLRAVQMAYDDTLRCCCRALDLPEPGSPSPLPAVDRLVTEASLARCGLTW